MTADLGAAKPVSASTRRRRHHGRSVAMICNYVVDVHYPAHFHQVYGTLLPGRGYRVATLAFYRDRASEEAQRELRHGTHLIRASAGRTVAGRLASGAVQIGRLLRSLLTRKEFGRADAYVVHNDPLLALVTYIWARTRGVPVLYRLTHLMPETAEMDSRASRRMVGRVARRMRNWVLPRCHGVLPTSPEMAEVLRAQVPIALERIHVLKATVAAPEPFEPRQTAECHVHTQRLKQRMREAACKEWLVYLGNLSPSRELGHLLDALAAVRARGHDAGLLVLGVSNRPAHLAALKDDAEARALSHCILWEAPVPEACLPAAVRLADIGVTPFPDNRVMRCNSPLKNLEYIRAGVPVVATAIPDSVEVMQGSGIGLAVPHDDPAAFADAVAELLDETPEARRHRVAGAQEWLRRNRSLEQACDIVDAALQHCLDGAASDAGPRPKAAAPS